MDIFSEAEIQALIVLLEVDLPKETANNNFYMFYPRNLEEAATYFRKYRCDWREAYPSLVAKGLLVSKNDEVTLTPAGIEDAERIRAARPPIWYWYKEYYSEAPISPAYAKFCHALYGKHLCQTNFSDMSQLDALLKVTALGPSNRVLDLGCGVGLIAEYISDVTKATVVGLDYMPEAIEHTRARTFAKRARLDFQIGNLDRLPFPPHSFDTLISIDTLYMPNDLDDTLAQMCEILQPDGQIAIFYSHMLWDEQSPCESLAAQQTSLGQALSRAGLSYSTQDFSAATYEHLQRKRRIATEMQADFAAEGRSFLYEYIMAESESNTAPFDPTTSRMSRYLYHVVSG